MFLFFIFIFFNKSEEYLDTLLSSADLVTYSNQFMEIGNISIDIKTSNYFIIFTEFPLNCTLYEYTSYDDENYELSSITMLNDIKLYRFIEFPFAKQIISMPFPGKISFTYGSIQDMCTTGIIISNYPQYSITLSKYSTNYTNIGRNEDKCIIFVIPTTQEFVVSLNGVNSDLYLYNNGAISTFTGTNFRQFQIHAENYPTIFRYKSDFLESISIKISMKSNEMDPSFAWTVFHDPSQIKHCPFIEECTLYKALHADIIIIVVCSVVSIIILAFIVRYIIKHKDLCKKKDKEPENKQQKADWPSQNDKGEIRTEPTGYFAMDPILRNQHYS